MLVENKVADITELLQFGYLLESFGYAELSEMIYRAKTGDNE